MVVGLFALDVATGDAAVLVVLYAAAPLLAALGCSVPGTMLVGVVTGVAALISTAVIDEPLDDEDLIRVAAVLLMSNLAVWTTVLRQRLELEARERGRLLHREREARTEAEDATRRADFLAEASAMFDQSLDEAETLERVARLMVREYASACLLVLVEPGGAGSQVSAAAREPAWEHELGELQEQYALEELPDHPMAVVMRSGSGVVIADLEAELQREPRRDRRHLELLHRLGLRASLTVPLRARERTHGALALGFDDLPPEAGADMLSLFEDVARRAALAIDNARLYEERVHVARTLQRSLLPPDLPDVPGMELAARYLAAGEGNEVGGDFYDCFSTGADDWALIIGDVCGKGAEAAAITALARYTVRASVLHSREPVTILSELNEAILRQGLQFQFCTALYAALEPDGDDRMRARLATGGHPLPLVLRAGGTVEVVGEPGTLLGIVPDPDLTAAQVDLAPGDALILYTDGVIEASPLDDAFGPERFAEFLAGCAGQDAETLAQSIENAVLSVQGGRLRDDVAVVVARAGTR